MKKAAKKNQDKKPVFVPPQQLRGNPFKVSGGGAKFNPSTFKTQHKG